MKARMIIEHAHSGRKWVGEWHEFENVFAELETEKNTLKENISQISYIEIDDAILPAEFIRNHCFIRFETNEVK